MTSEEKREYNQRYRAKNREKLLAQMRDYYVRVRKPKGRPTRRKDLTARCYCGVLLASKFGSKYGKTTCDDCRRSLAKRRHRLYQRRKYQKKHGLPVEAITVDNLFRSPYARPQLEAPKTAPTLDETGNKKRSWKSPYKYKGAELFC